jgi:arylsulfatase A-like enzyme
MTWAAALLLVFAIAACSGEDRAPAPAATASPVGTGTADPGRKPNIVFIFTDDQRADEFEYMPKTQALVGDAGARLPNFFITTPVCCPSRASMLRGQYAHNHGVLTNAVPRGGFQTFVRADHEESTYATWLQGYLGKYLNGYPDASAPLHIPPGWDNWLAPAEASTAIFRHFNYALNIDGQLVQFGASEQDYFTDVLRKHVTGFIRVGRDDPRPFLAVVSVTAPHSPFVPAPRHRASPVPQRPISPSFDEEDVSDKPSEVAGLARLSASQRALIDSV